MIAVARVIIMMMRIVNYNF